VPAARLKRAALYAIGGTLTVACGSTAAPLYGSTPIFDASRDAEDLSDAAYGGAPGFPGDSGLVTDSGPDGATADDACAHRVNALYGGPATCIDEDN
jgi:hypothetical protein